MRSVLTTLGIVIGVGAVIAMMEIGQGSSHRDPADHRQHGRQQPDDLPGHGVQRRRQLRRRQRHDADARGRRGDPPRVPRGQGRRADRARRARRSSTATRTGCRSYIYGTTPDVPGRPRLDDLAEGEPFTDRDVRNAEQGLPARPDDRPRAVRRRVAASARRSASTTCSFKVIGVLAPQGREHDGLRPGRHPARPVDDDQVPRRRPVGDSGNQRRGRVAAARREQRQHAQQPLPAASVQLYPEPSAAAGGQHAAAGAVHQHRPDHRRGRRRRADPDGDRADHRGAARAAPHPARASPTTSTSAT